MQISSSLLQREKGRRIFFKKNDYFLPVSGERDIIDYHWKFTFTRQLWQTDLSFDLCLKTVRVFPDGLKTLFKYSSVQKVFALLSLKKQIVSTEDFFAKFGLPLSVREIVVR